MFKWFSAGVGYLAAVLLGSILLTPSHDSGRSHASAKAVTGHESSQPANNPTLSRTTTTADKSSPRIGSGFITAPATRSYDAQSQRQRWTFRKVETNAHAATEFADKPSKASIARSIQREMVRAGCGKVPVTGSWDKRTRSTMARFVANRNAALPVDKPDVILLSLLRTYRSSNCGVATKSRVARNTKPSDFQKNQSSRLVQRSRQPFRQAPRQARVISGWSKQTTTSVRLGPASAAKIAGAAGTANAGSSGAIRASGYLPSSRISRYGNRMTLGAARPSDLPTGPSPSVGVQQQDIFAPATTTTDAANARRLDAKRARALRRENARKKRRRWARQRYYRRRSTSWKTRAFATEN